MIGNVDLSSVLNQKTGFTAKMTRIQIVVAGDDATAFLQGQLSQDVESISVGEAFWSYLLSPNGKTVALLRFWKHSDNEYFAFVEPNVAARVVERLQAFLFRVKASIATETVDLWCLRGDATKSAGGFDCGWLGVIGCDSLTKPAGDFAEDDGRLFETLRIALGVPSNEYELSEPRIPQEIGYVENAVSFDKGCYVGQELVARINSRGRVVRTLRGLLIDSHADSNIGDLLTLNDKLVGDITSVAPLAVEGNKLALGFVQHDIDSVERLYSSNGGYLASVSTFPLLSFSA